MQDAVKFEDFKISACPHSMSTRRRPIIYGCVDGWSVTAPCHVPELAIQHATSALNGTGYLVSLLSSLDCFQGWLKQGLSEERNQEAIARIADVRQRLKKLSLYLVDSGFLDAKSQMAKDWLSKAIHEGSQV